jgi:hypothetical protein
MNIIIEQYTSPVMEKSSEGLRCTAVAVAGLRAGMLRERLITFAICDLRFVFQSQIENRKSKII